MAMYYPLNSTMITVNVGYFTCRKKSTQILDVYQDLLSIMIIIMMRMI